MNFLCSFFILILCAVTSYATELTPVIEVEGGSVRGRIIEFRGNNVYQFFGIPYAESPTGNLRFKRPLPRSPWKGVHEGTEWGPQCHQAATAITDMSIPMSEDCLTATVFVSETAFNERENKKRPVMVWIHGGGFNFGSANIPGTHDGTPLVVLQDIVFVSINYRLGALGFLHSPEHGIEGNMGLWDQILGLKWAKANVEKFGGDPDQITIFGESAGGMSVSFHLISQHSRGLFKNAILQSGSIYNAQQWAHPSIHKNFLSITGCLGSSDIHSCLQNYDIRKFKDAVKYLFWPIIGDELIPKDPRELVIQGQIDPSINILLGAVGNEGYMIALTKDPITFNPMNPANLTLSQSRAILSKILGSKSEQFYYDRYLKDLEPSDTVSLRENVAKAFGDTLLTCPTYVNGVDLARLGLNVYAYYQSQAPKVRIIPGLTDKSWMGATHADDILMVFGYPFLEPEKYDIEDVVLSSVMMNIWGTFAREGKPPAIGPTEWLPWETFEKLPSTLMTVELNSKKIGVIDNKIAEFCLINYPFPVDSPVALETELGIFLKLDHDEL